MPKQTFFNLPEEKRQKLLDAIHAEFTRVPYDEVSINQIIRAAGISRGSFYQYFEGKQDVLEYLLDEYRKRAMAQAKQSLANSNGDLFLLFLDLLDFTHAFLTHEGDNDFCRNMFADIRHNVEFLIPPQKPHDHISPLRDMLFDINKDELDIQSPEDFDNMLGILLPLAGYTFAQAFYDTANYGAVRAQFVSRLDILRRGFMKNKGTTSERV